MSNLKTHDNPLPLLAIPFVGTLGAKATFAVVALATTATIVVANQITKGMGWRQVDSSVIESLSSRQEYQAIIERILILLELLEQGHTYSSVQALSDAMGDEFSFSFYGTAKNTILASLIATNYLLGAALLCDVPESRKTLADEAIKIFNSSVDSEGTAKGSMSMESGASGIVSILMSAYELILRSPFANKRTKLQVINRLSMGMNELGVQAAQYDQKNIDLIVQEEVLMAKCMSEKPYGGILAALAFKSKPICYTDREWLIFRIATWSVVLGVTGAIIAYPLQQAQFAGEILGEAARQYRKNPPRRY